MAAILYRPQYDDMITQSNIFNADPSQRTPRNSSNAQAPEPTWVSLKRFFCIKLQSSICTRIIFASKANHIRPISYSDVTWALGRLKSAADRFNELFGERIKKAPPYRPFMTGIHRWPKDAPSRGTVMPKMLPRYGVIMLKKVGNSANYFAIFCWNWYEHSKQTLICL